jgi:16S rRNA (cytidine1402-2'-O)-methyltransferase
MPEGRLYVCGTPIGNLGDVSDRLRSVLVSADVVFAEDTRRTAVLLSHVGSDSRLRSLFVGNEETRADEVVGAVESGQTVALVTDAGMPVISDPGAEAVRRVRSAGLSISIVPGPSAVSSAMALSGFVGDRFVFEGFLPKKGQDREARIAQMANDERPVVLFVSPHRLVSDLESLRGALGSERVVAVTRELTKLHEETWVGTLTEAVDVWSNRAAKGEFTIVLAPGEARPISEAEAVEAARAEVAAGKSPSAAAREVAESSGVSRRTIYQSLIDD